jgi:hypothetical protein
MKQPALIPAVPNPEMTLPKMSAADDVVVPEIKDPISKMTTETENLTLMENLIYNFPNITEKSMMSNDCKG